jgi:hypothetical protein
MRDSDNNIAEQLKLGSGFSMRIACYPVFPMLCGLSLEVLYKAICVRKDIKFNSTHNLIFLARDAQIDITDEESKFLLNLLSGMGNIQSPPINKNMNMIN